MAYNLKDRSFVKEIDFDPGELRFLLDLSTALKSAKYAGTETPQLEGKEIALLFEKTSTRTRDYVEKVPVSTFSILPKNQPRPATEAPSLATDWIWRSVVIYA